MNMSTKITDSLKPYIEERWIKMERERKKDSGKGKGKEI